MRWALLLPLALAGCDRAAEQKQVPSTPTAAMPITLPADLDVLPKTKAGELVAIACTACHSPDMIAAQPPLSEKQWAATVKKMREAYHAPIAKRDDAAIVRALVAIQRN